MTITHDAQLDLRAPTRSLLTALAAGPLAVIFRIREWHRAGVHARTVAKLPLHLKRDIGEIDHLPRRNPFQEKPQSHQERLEAMWMR